MEPLKDETVEKLKQLGGEFKEVNNFTFLFYGKPHLQTEVQFPNGYGVSITKIYDPGKDGSERFLEFREEMRFKSPEDYWKIEVLDKNGEIDYNNPVTQGDTIRGLTDDEVVSCCEAISSLKKRND